MAPGDIWLVMLRVEFEDTLLLGLGLEGARCEVKRMLTGGL